MKPLVKIEMGLKGGIVMKIHCLQTSDFCLSYFRKRLSCPSTGTELPFLCFDNLRPTSLDFTGVNRLSGTIQEMPDSPMPVGDEFVVLDRETQDDVMNDIEMCRTLLLDLGVLICQVRNLMMLYIVLSFTQDSECARLSLLSEIRKGQLHPVKEICVTD